MTDLRTRVLGLLRPYVGTELRSRLADSIVTAAGIVHAAELEQLDRANAKLALDFAAVSVERDSLRGVVQAVEALHQKRTATVFSNHHHVEDHLSEDERCDDRCFVPFDLCNGCGGSWPCSTARALAAAAERSPDALQPATCEHGKHAPHIYPNNAGGPAVMRHCAGPSPAVLPDRKASE